MAQSYAMPPDTNEEENIIGGVMNKYQLVWLVIGCGVGAFFTVIFFMMIGAVALFFAVPPIIAGCVFAFYKVENMTLFSYLRYKRRYNKALKHYINFGNHDEIEVIVKEEEREEDD